MSKPESDAITWTSRPWAEDAPVRRATLVVLVVGASALAGHAFGSLWAGLISVGFLFVSLSRYFLPSTYELTSDGIRVRHMGMSRFLPWSRFRRVALRGEGVFLGTFSAPRRLDIWRGCYLRCPNERDAVYTYARAHLPLGSHSTGGEPRAGDAAAPRTDTGG